MDGIKETKVSENGLFELADALRRVSISSNDRTPNGELVNIADALLYVANAIHRVADAIEGKA